MLKNSLVIILVFFSIIFLVAGSFLFFIICISLSALFLLKSFKFSLVKHNTEKQNTNIKNKTTKTTWIIGGIMIISIILLFILGIDSQNNYSSQTPKKINTNDIGDKIDLHVQAQQFVLQGLKAPATAKFPALPYEAIDIGNDRYKIMSLFFVKKKACTFTKLVALVSCAMTKLHKDFIFISFSCHMCQAWAIHYFNEIFIHVASIAQRTN